MRARGNYCSTGNLGLVIKPGTERNEMERNETKRNEMEKIVESVYSNVVCSAQQADSGFSKHTEYTSAGLNPMLRGLVPGLGYPMLRQSGTQLG